MHVWQSPFAVCFMDKKQNSPFLVDKCGVWPFEGLKRQKDPIEVDTMKVEWEGVTDLPLICFQKATENRVALDMFCRAIDSATKKLIESSWSRFVFTANLVQEFAGRIDFSWSIGKSPPKQTKNALLWRYMVLMEAIMVKDDNEWLPDDEMFRVLFQFLAEIVAQEECGLHSVRDAKDVFSLDKIQRGALVDIVAIVKSLLSPEGKVDETGQRDNNAGRYWVWLLEMLRDVVKDEKWKEVLRTVLLYACDNNIPVSEKYQCLVDAFQVE